MGRMTWIKPSFLWMMSRSGWATKPGQEHVLAVRMSRAGFENILGQGRLSANDPEVYPSREVVAAAQTDEPGTDPVGPGAIPGHGSAALAHDPDRDGRPSGPQLRQPVDRDITEVTNPAREMADAVAHADRNRARTCYRSRRHTR